MDFALPDQGMMEGKPNHWRPLKLITGAPQMRGWDVYAFQTALLGLGYRLPKYGADGFWGRETDQATRQCQTDNGLEVDGIAGGATQREVCALLEDKYSRQYNIKDRLIHGQVEHE